MTTSNKYIFTHTCFEGQYIDLCDISVKALVYTLDGITRCGTLSHVSTTTSAIDVNVKRIDLYDGVSTSEFN